MRFLLGESCFVFVVSGPFTTSHRGPGPKLQKDMAVLKVTTVGATWRNGSFSYPPSKSMGLVYSPAGIP